jgi:hypothetical protein
VEGVKGYDKHEKQAARGLSVLYMAIGDPGTSGLAHFTIKVGEGKGIGDER